MTCDLKSGFLIEQGAPKTEFLGVSVQGHLTLPGLPEKTALLFRPEPC